jgi:hypothetical protein
VGGVWLPLAPPAPAAADDAPAARVSCRITDPRIVEASGLAVAGNRMYVVNDGGVRVTVFELDRSCRVVRVLTRPTDPYDVEDLARTADGRLWLADTGDNRETRQTVALEVFPPSGRLALYRFAYPDGAHDAEALLVDRSGRPFVVTKDPFGSSGVYTPDGEPSPDRTVALRRVATLHLLPTGTPGGPVGAVSQVLVTGGAVSPDGTRVALRTYTDLYLWSVRDGDVAAALRDGRPTRIPLPEEQQGEAVAFSPDGRSVLTTSEGSPTPVHEMALPPPPSPSASPTQHSGGRDGSGRPDEASGAGQHDGNSRPLWLNGLLAAVIATIVVSGLGRLRRK